MIPEKTTKQEFEEWANLTKEHFSKTAPLMYNIIEQIRTSLSENEVVWMKGFAIESVGDPEHSDSTGTVRVWYIRASSGYDATNEEHDLMVPTKLIVQSEYKSKEPVPCPMAIGPEGKKVEYDFRL